MTQQVIIYDGRLRASKEELIVFLDNKVNEVRLPSPQELNRDDYFPPDTHLLIDHFIQKHSEEIATQEQIENTINSVMGKPHPGKVFLHTHWYGDIQITWGWMYLQEEGGLVEFNDGQIELYPSKKSKKPFTNVIIKSELPERRSYWEWMVKRLKNRFKELRKGGPKATPRNEKIRIVREWREKQGKILKENFCSNHAISISTLRNWEKELKGLV
ncbi:MAG: hypothetical protein AABZ00_14500 [Chloroflexota bacterium]